MLDGAFRLTGRNRETDQENQENERERNGLTQKRLTVLVGSYGDRRGGGPFAAFRFGRQPNVIERVGLEAVEDIRFTDGQRPMMFLLIDQVDENDHQKKSGKSKSKKSNQNENEKKERNGRRAGTQHVLW
jgi:hypothetical protein